MFFSAAHRLHHLLDDETAVADDRHVGPAHLAELGGVDVDVDDLGALREAVELAGDAVVEARPQRDEQVGLLHRGDRGVVAVHAGHAQAPLVVVGERAARHQGGDHGEAGELDQLAQRLGGACLQDAAAGVDHRALRLAHEPGGVLDLLGVALGGGLVAGEVDRLGPVPVHRLVGDVLGHVDEHRAGTAGGRHVERLPHHPRDVGGVGDEPVVLGDRHGDADGVGFLERVGADHRVRHLPGHDDQGDAVHVGVAQRRDDVGRRRAARDHGHARAPGGVGVPLRHVPGALLVAHEDVADRRVDERVVDREDRTAGKAEHDLGVFHLEALDERLGAGELHGECFLVGLWRGLQERLSKGTGQKKPPAWARGEYARARGRAVR